MPLKVRGSSAEQVRKKPGRELGGPLRSGRTRRRGGSGKIKAQESGELGGGGQRRKQTLKKSFKADKQRVTEKKGILSKRKNVGKCKLVGGAEGKRESEDFDNEPLDHV